MSFQENNLTKTTKTGKLLHENFACFYKGVGDWDLRFGKSIV
jgi:hypothetical protein